MNTPEYIIAFLSKNGPGSVSEIALSLNLTRADIRYHLKLLLSSQQVVKIDQNEISSKRGRPAARYEIKQALSPDNLEALLNLLSHTMLASKDLNQIVDEIWQQEIKSFPSRTSSKNRIDYTLKFLHQLGVQAIWIARKSGPQIKILNNPYRKENLQLYYPVVDSLINKAINYAVNE
jgi:predicted ArsR family transcriptional regulator